VPYTPGSLPPVMRLLPVVGGGRYLRDMTAADLPAGLP
jgi:hypothetical protein